MKSSTQPRNFSFESPQTSSITQTTILRNVQRPEAQFHIQTSIPRDDFESGMDDPFSNQIEGDPVTPCLDIVAHEFEMLIICFALDEELHNQGRGNEEDDGNHVAQEGECQQFCKTGEQAESASAQVAQLPEV